MHQPGTYHILYILDHFTPYCGGSEHVFEKIVQGAIQAGHKATVITTRHSDDLLAIEKQGNLTIVRRGENRYSLFFRGIIEGLKIRKKISIIHTTTYAGALPARIISIVSSIPIIITVHELLGNLRKQQGVVGYCFLVYEKIIMKIHYDKIIAVSQYTQQCLKKRYGKSSTLIYNGLDKDFWSGKAKNGKINTLQVPAKSFTLLYFGHSGFTKGVDLFIESFDLLFNTYPDLHIIINLLPSKNKTQTVQNLQQYISSGKISLLQGVPINQLRNLLNTVDCIIIPSRSEGFCLAAAQASLVNTPLITTKNGALPEVVSGKVVFLEGENPLHFLDSLIAVRSKTYQLIPHHNFNRKTMIDSYLLIYQRLNARISKKSHKHT